MKSAIILAIAAGTAVASPTTINGSGSSSGTGGGFGSVIGNGSTVNVTTTEAGDVNMRLFRGAGQLFDVAIIYIDSVAGGVTNTSQINDIGDPGRAAISGNGFGGEFSDLGFATGFGADYAITLETAFSGVFGLNAGANHTFVSSASTDGPRTAGDASFGVAFNLSQIGLTAGDSFRYVITYLNGGNAFRSNEFHGVASGPADNIGNNTFGIGNFNLADGDFVTVNTVPTPGAAALLGLGALAAGRRRR